MNQGVDTAMIGRAQSLMDKFSSMTPAPNVFRFATDTQKNANANVAFPVQLGSTDPEDEKYAMRAKMMTGAGGAVVPGVGQVIADSSFFDYAKRKKDQESLYDFYRFMMSNARLDTPEAAQWWFGKFPWMRDLRLAEIDKQAELQKALARIQITGPESEDDFMLLFLIRNGTIVLPNYPLHQMGEKRPVAESFQAGFFSPFSRDRTQGSYLANTNPFGNVDNQGWMKQPTGFGEPKSIVSFTNPLSRDAWGNNTMGAFGYPANFPALTTP